MSTQNLIRAWKDEEYRLSLSEAERALLPENPAGSVELTDAELDQAAGGGGGCCCFCWSFFGGGFGCNYTCHHFTFAAPGGGKGNKNK